MKKSAKLSKRKGKDEYALMRLRHKETKEIDKTNDMELLYHALLHKLDVALSQKFKIRGTVRILGLNSMIGDSFGVPDAAHSGTGESDNLNHLCTVAPSPSFDASALTASRPRVLHSQQGSLRENTTPPGCPSPDSLSCLKAIFVRLKRPLRVPPRLTIV
eukprot:IDg3499t1